MAMTDPPDNLPPTEADIHAYADGVLTAERSERLRLYLGKMRDLVNALQRLPAEQREVVLFVGLEEMSYAEVALTLNIPLGTVMSRLSRGRERLRAIMAGTRPGAKLRVVR
jgi:RNA polymerase sigma factor (sigma-70 family)